METSRHLQINILIETFLEGKYSEVRDNNTKMTTYFQDPRSWQCKRAKTRWDLTIADVAPPSPIHKELKKDSRVLLTWLSDVDSLLCQKIIHQTIHFYPLPFTFMSVYVCMGCCHRTLTKKKAQY